MTSEDIVYMNVQRLEYYDDCVVGEFYFKYPERVKTDDMVKELLEDKQLVGLETNKFKCLERYPFGLKAGCSLGLPEGNYHAQLTKTSKKIDDQGSDTTILVSCEEVAASRRILYGHVGNSSGDSAGCMLYGLETRENSVQQSTKAGRFFSRHVQVISHLFKRGLLSDIIISIR